MVNPRAKQEAFDVLRLVAVQTGLELGQLGKRRDNEDYVDYGVRVETMLDKLNTLLRNADRLSLRAKLNNS